MRNLIHTSQPEDRLIMTYSVLFIIVSIHYSCDFSDFMQAGFIYMSITYYDTINIRECLYIR